MKLIGKKFKVASNITITSDIIEYNKGLDITRGLYIKKVSNRQSFVYNPTSTYQVGNGSDVTQERLDFARKKLAIAKKNKNELVYSGLDSDQ